MRAEFQAAGLLLRSSYRGGNGPSAGDVLSSQEVEVKIAVGADELEDIRRTAVTLGFRLSEPRRREENFLFDFPDGRLRTGDAALRLRSYGPRSVLTFKGPQVDDPELKIREEIETQVESFEAVRRILRKIGLEPSFHYAKEREMFVLERPGRFPVSLCVDETPFGCFVEIEGSGHDIRETAARLGWSSDRFITRSYVDLYAEHGLGT